MESAVVQRVSSWLRHPPRRGVGPRAWREVQGVDSARASRSAIAVTANS